MKNRKIPIEKLNRICMDCVQKCKQKAAVTVLDCPRYRRKDMQLGLKFTFDNKTTKRD